MAEIQDGRRNCDNAFPVRDNNFFLLIRAGFPFVHEFEELAFPFLKKMMFPSLFFFSFADIGDTNFFSSLLVSFARRAWNTCPHFLRQEMR